MAIPSRLIPTPTQSASVTFAVGAYFTKVNDKLVLKIALNKKRRAWFSGLWNYSKVFAYPFIFSNA